ncbi:type I polyketide synthase [Streptomyces sp. RPA4-5]|uniref:type I polyketide synthase n=1 Tax=Streptomyces sp. RPA4-5 TaxID=2721245 RepID=UPI0032B33B22
MANGGQPTADDAQRLRDYLTRVVAELQHTRRRIRDLESAADEPIAIVGMSCRYPGDVRSPADLWRLVSTGQDPIGPLPANRGWDLSSADDPSWAGGFVEDAGEFDADLFGISPREALAMDPQQRLLLETSWKAFEDAGLDPLSLRGSGTGVFVGVTSVSYGPGMDLPEDVAGHLMTGTASSIASGRVSYTFGLEGPAVTVDTACSSSLVALHLAVQSLREGGCDLALVGGVTVMTTPMQIVEFGRQGGLASDGRCKAFSDDADGAGWSEGIGLLLVERLSDARRNGHRVLAVVRGSAINQDGASNGLTAPNGPAQERVIRRALANARLSVEDVDAVEGHGTGTRLGDPIEARALLATYGRGRSAERPLWLGSIKSNIGHTQSAAGVAGVIKMVMAMRDGTLPPTLHADRPSTQVDWSPGTVRLLTDPRPWPTADRPRRAAVSSFGMSGTNAHVILEQAPEPEPAEQDAAQSEGTGPALTTGPLPWPLAAKTADGLRGQAVRLRDVMTAHDAPEPVDVARSLLTRAALPSRAVVLGTGRAELLAGLDALADDESTANLVRGAAAGTAGVVLVFPGQGSQWAGMARELRDTSPAFRQRLAECEEALAPFVPWSLSAVLSGAPDAPDLSRVDVVQPVLWAVMVSLAEAWRSVGVRPAAVVGHSQGEIAAAVVAGGLSLDDGARVVALRSRALAVLAGRGGMVSLPAGREQVAGLIAPWGDGLCVAAENGPHSTVVSGEAGPVEELLAECERRGLRARRIPVDYASHSPQVEELRERILADLAPVRPGSSGVAFYSTVTGAPIDTARMDATYWYENLRSPVRFETATRALLADGRSVFVESSPHPVLTIGVQETAEEAGTPATVIGTLRREDGGPDRLLAGAAELWTAGVPVDWSAAFEGGARTELPTYAFQRRRYWPDPLPPQTWTARDGDPAESAFWDAVEREDTEELAATLRLDEARGVLDELLPALSGWHRGRRRGATIDSWRYRVTWTPVPDLPAHPRLSGRWLLALPEGGDPRELAEVLRSAGAEVVPLTVTADADRTELAALLRAAGPVDGVVQLPETAEDAPLAPAGPAATVTLLQALGDAGIDAPLWSLTAGAVSIGRSDPLRSPAQALSWGLGRVAALEYPRRWGGLIDLPATVDARVGARLVALLSGTAGDEDQLAVRGSGVFARRLVRAPRPTGTRRELPGSVLVTGGTGALGAVVARWLAGRGVPHLTLLGRRGEAAPGVAELVAELTALGTRVTVAACDVTDREALADVLAQVPAEFPLVGVVHAAGVGQAMMLDRTGSAELTEVLGGKVAGALHLDELTRGLGLRMFVTFASGAGIWGSGGQAAYAAANAYLDALVVRRRAEGLPGTSVSWGAWGDVGMVSTDAVRDHLRERGMVPMDPDLAIEALAQAVDADEDCLTVADIDWPRFVDIFTAGRVSPLLADLPEARTAEAAPAGEEERPDLARRLAPLPEAQRRQILLDLVRTEVAAVLKHPDVRAVEAARTFKDLGFESLTAVELRNRLNRETGLRLPATMVFDHPTPTALAAWLERELDLGAPAAPTGSELVASAPAGLDEPIAIVGMGCRFPGGVRSPEDLWTLVEDGADALSSFPTDRGWPDRMPGVDTAVGGFVHDATEFDAGMFGISPREALAMDPQQRLLLETAWEAFEAAGIDPHTMRGSRTGVFVGASSSGYGHGQLLDGVEGHVLSGTANSVISGRVSYVFGLEGPAVTVDTACSSSLVALHLAAQALRVGECGMALAGGVAVMVNAGAFGEFNRQGGLASDGRCKAFAAGADGTGWGEGVGVLVLERLSDALRNGHEVLAVVRGSAVNQDGASNGLTAPNGPSQERVIRQALASAGLSAAEVDAVEAHGTGTRLGDPIEAQALLATYGQDRAGDPLWLGSVKSNLGHTQAAAGVAGVIKTVQAMRHGVLPATLHVDEPSPHVDWSAGEVELLTETRRWPEADRSRRAGVSAFGISGTNAHVVLEAAPAVVEVETEVGTEVSVGSVGMSGLSPWVVSAQSAGALRAQAARLAEVLGPEDRLWDVAWSLATGRAGLAHRAVVLGADRDGMVDGLAAVVEGRPSGAVVSGTVREGRTAFLFTGQGSQRVGMGRELYAAHPVFAEVFDAVCAEFDLLLDRSVRDVVFEDAADLDRTVWAQAGLFAVEVATFRLLESWGVTPDFLLGHSIGEVAAAHCAGVFSLADACALVAARGRLMQALPEGGAMLAVQATEAEVRAEMDGRLDVAAVNGPSSVVVSGPVEVVEEFAARWSGEGRKTRRLTVSHAFHSALMEPMLAEFASVLEGLTFVEPQIPVVSNLTGKLAEPGLLTTPDYWVRQVREAVRFAGGVETLSGQGVTSFVELGPDAVLCGMAGQSVGEAVFAPVMRRDRGEEETALRALAALWAAGAGVDWSTVLPVGRRVSLPTYAFQRERYWPESIDLGSLAADPAETRFWKAVENRDMDELAEALEIAQAPEELGSVLPVLSSWRQRRRVDSVVDSWRYEVTWKPLAGATAGRLSGRWLLVTASGASVEGVEAALVAAGAEVVPMSVDGADRNELADRIRELLVEGESAGVVSMVAVGEEPGVGGSWVSSGVAGTLTLLQALGDARVSCPVWAVTVGGVSVGRADRLVSPVQAQVWGLGRVAALELPDVWGGLVDLPEVVDERAGRRLVAVLSGAGGEDQAAIRSSGVYGRRFVRAARSAGRTGEWSPSGTVLVTGGLGALGASVARWLAGRGVPHLVLTGRRGGETPGAAELVAELSALGARVTVAACDVADRDAVAAVLAAVPAELPLTGVVHTAGVVDDGVLDGQSVERFESVLAGKVGGVVHLDELTSGLDLDLFVVFSSVAATWGGSGQGVYAAANAHLDALVQLRRSRGLRGTSVAWGPWAGEGMAAQGEIAEQLRRRGLAAMDPRLAVLALARAVEGDEGCVTVADVDWALFAPVFTSARTSPLLADLPEVGAALAPVVAAVEQSSAFRAGLVAAPAARRERLLLDLVRSCAAAVLGHASAESVDAGRAFRDLGFDSLTAVSLRNLLSRDTGLSLPATLAFDYPTPVVLAAYLAGELGESAPVVGAVSEVSAGVVSSDDPVVVVGMSARYPGGVRSADELWELVAAGVDGVTGFPADRGWSLGGVSAEAARGGFVESATEFDAGLFGISPREALAMDPQQRLLLEASWEAFEDAGIDPRSVRGAQVGVFAGASSSGYGAGGGLEEAQGHLLAGTANSVISGRVSYAFGLEGPAVTVDTACSSSLVALHWAAQALREGDCELALAGGVTVLATPGVFGEFDRQGGLAADGRCKAFSADADGTGWGEGVGMLLVERLSDARRNGHEVLAVVRGSAVNQDGASNGLTAPNGPAQQRVIRQALANAGLEASEVDVVEAHGTGTVLGDPIEAQALLATYGRERAGEPLWLGSIKSNIGHTQAAAGVAGVIKMVQAMRHGVLPATLHADEPSPQVDWSSGAVELLTEARSWPEADRPRRAGVSSFGISGTNAHVIIERPEPEREPEPESRPEPADHDPAQAPGLVPWPLSARTAEGLRAQADRLRGFVQDGRPADLRAVGRALATTRAALEHRAVVVGADREELLRGLAAVADGVPSAAVVSEVVGDGRVAFLFTGQGAQRAGMGRDLHARFPVFAEAFDAVCAEFDLLLDRPVKDVVFQGTDLERTVWAQAGLFAVEVALFRLLESWGVVPEALLGHSIGEIAAAHVAGVFSLADACALVAARGRLMQALPEGGAMLAVEVTEAEARAATGDRLDIAAVNGPAAVVVSGDAEAIEEFAARWSAEGVRTRRLTVSHAFHSALMEPMLAEFALVLRGLTFGEPAIPLVSGLTGELAGPGLLSTPEYWVRQVREAVRFADGVDALHRQGLTRFVELGPDGVLSALVARIVPDAVGAPLLREGRDHVQAAVGRLWAAGVPVDWAAVLPGGRRVSLPTYAFQRDRYWPEPVPAPEPADPAEERFWAAVECEDLDELAETLDAPPEAVDTALTALSSWRRRRQQDARTDAWRYRVVWRPMTVPSGRAALDGTWLIVAPEGEELAAEAQSSLTAAGARVLRLTLDDAVDGTGRTALAERLRAALDPAVELAGVLAVPGDRVAQLVTLVQALDDTGLDARLWAVTSGAVSTGPSDPLSGPGQATVWGLSRGLDLAGPECWGGIVDLPVRRDAAARDRFAHTIAGAEREAAVRDGRVFVRRLVPAPAGAADSPAWPATGTVLVTGGTGALGRRVARRLARRGVPRLLLVGRRGPEAPGVAELLAEVRSAGAEVTVAACDVADREALAGTLAAIPEEHPLTAVVHAAGVGDDTAPDALTPGRIAEVLRPTVDGARHLHELTEGMELSAFVLFSSVAGVWGAAQPARAAANAYLDALAESRRAAGLTATSIAWGPWADERGLTADATGLLARTGLRALAPDAALDLLDRLPREACLTVADVDWERFAASYTLGRPRRLLDEIRAARRTGGTDDRPVRADAVALRERLAGMPGEERHRVVLDLVRAHVATVLGYEGSEAVAPDRSFLELGVNSLSAIELRDRLRTAVGVPLASTVVFDSGTATELAGRVQEALSGAGAAEPREQTGLLRTLYGESMRQNKLHKFMEFLSDAASYRPMFGSPEEISETPAPVFLARGPKRPRVVCHTGMSALGGVHEFARFAASFNGSHDVIALPLPGYREGEELPTTLEVSLDWQARTLVEVAGDAPFVLLGHSGGGLLAHALTRRLESMGVPVAGVVLVDTYPMDRPMHQEWLSELTEGTFGREELAVPMTDTRLTAQAWYGRMYLGFRAEEVAAPTLVVRASDPIGEWTREDDWRATWDRPHRTVDVPGNHFTLMMEHGATTAAAVREWLGTVAGADEDAAAG